MSSRTLLDLSSAFASVPKSEDVHHLELELEQTSIERQQTFQTFCQNALKSVESHLGRTHQLHRIMSLTNNLMANKGIADVSIFNYGLSKHNIAI